MCFPKFLRTPCFTVHLRLLLLGLDILGNLNIVYFSLSDLTIVLHEFNSLQNNSTQNLHPKFTFAYTRFFFISNLGFCLELGLLNSKTEIGTGVA